MLVLSRKRGEQIQIGSDVTISILEVQGRRVRIGIEAPQSTHVLRGEIAEWDQGAPNERRRDRRTALVAPY